MTWDSEHPLPDPPPEEPLSIYIEMFRRASGAKRFDVRNVTATVSVL